MSTATTASKTTISLSDDQQDAVDRIEQWISTPSHCRGDFVFSGFAGTGKTTVISHLWPMFMQHDMLFLGPTGKSVEMMRQKGMKAMTIHAAIYYFRGTYERNDGNEIPIFEDRDEWKGRVPKLLGVDEASMCDARVYSDLKSKGLSILFCGDNGQLEPVGEDPGIMKRPNVSLEKIHRQAEGSSILKMAHSVRQGDGFSHVDNKSTFLARLPTVTSKVSYAIDKGIDQSIVAMNATRHAFNKIYRSKKGLSGMLDPGDRIVIKANCWDSMLFNGQSFTIKSIEDDQETYYRVNMVDRFGAVRKNVQLQKISLGNREYKSSMKVEGKIVSDYAYAITAHSAQGDSFGKVLYVDEPCKLFSTSRHRYTGITRAINEIHVAI
jgi:exodeoxyribonuclease-5